MGPDRYRAAIVECESLLQISVKAVLADFPPARSTNEQIGFRLRKGRLRRELGAYLELYIQYWGGLPCAQVLIAAGRYIYPRFEKRDDWCRWPRPNEVLVTSAESFLEISDEAWRLREGGK